MRYKWKSVNDELPHIGEEVIAYYGNKFIGHAWLNQNEIWVMSSGHAHTLFPVTHWCRYPPKNQAISVKNQLPPVGKPVIVYVGEHTTYVAKINSRGRWATPDDETEYIRLHVTHWADFPTPPM